MNDVPRQKEETKTNGTSNDAVMIIDSDDDGPPAKPTQPFLDNPIFEEEEAEYDSLEPYHPIVQHLDLPLGTEVLHVSFPHLPSELHRLSLESLPKIFSQRLVLALACSDFSIRILTLPLIPPSPHSKTRPELRDNVSLTGTGNGHFGEQMMIIPSVTGHQSLPSGVSMTFTAHVVSSPDIKMEDEGEDDLDVASRTSHPSPARSRSRSIHAEEDSSRDLLIASHSADLSGLLLIHKIPLTVDGAGIDTKSADYGMPWRTQYLPSPAVSIQFNSSLYPAKRHSEVLIAEAKGVVRVYDCLSQSEPDRGSWLISLHTNFQDGLPKRRPILDAQWVLGGKAILVLLADGEWGIWDIENAGPKAKKAIGASQNTARDYLTSFAIRGLLGSSLTTSNPIKSSSRKNESRSKLAPMTPGTRRIRQEALFTGPVVHPSGPSRGGLCVLPTNSASSNRADDESLLLWHGHSIITIPSLLTHWQNKVQGSGNLFGSGAKGQQREITNIQLGGELRTGVTLFPESYRPGGKREAATAADVLVMGEYRFIIVTPPLTEPEPSTPPNSSPLVDQQLLARGELDVNGMERILTGMTNGEQRNSGNHRVGVAVAKRKVGFLTSR